MILNFYTNTRIQGPNSFQMDNYKIWAWEWFLDNSESDGSYKKNSYNKKCVTTWGKIGTKLPPGRQATRQEVFIWTFI